MRAVAAAAVIVMLVSASGCVIGTWRMHPGANMGRVQDSCTDTPVCDGDGCHCHGGAEAVNPGPFAFDVGVQIGHSTGALGSDSPTLSYAANAGASYVLPNDRVAFGVELTYLMDRQGQPDGRTTDAVVGFGANAIAQLALGTRFVVHAGAGAMRASYETHVGDPNEVDSASSLAPRALAGATLIMARNRRRDLFVTVQATAMHLPTETVAGAQLGGATDLTVTAALGLALAP